MEGLREHCDWVNVEHRTVNHSKWFKDPVTGACKNVVEGFNGSLKASVPPQYRTEGFIGAKLGGIEWRKRNNGNLAVAFVGALKFYIERQ